MEPMIYIFAGRSHGLGSGVSSELFFKIQIKFCDYLPMFTGATLKVLLALASYIDDKGYCYPPLEAIASKTGLNPQTVSDAVTRLSEMTLEGAPVLLALQAQEAPGRFANNRYILFPSLDDIAANFKDIRRRRPGSGPKPKAPPADPGQPPTAEPAPARLAELTPAEAARRQEINAALDAVAAASPLVDPLAGPAEPYVQNVHTVNEPQNKEPYVGFPYTVNPILTRTIINQNDSPNGLSAGAEPPPPPAKIKKPKVYKPPAPELMPDSDPGEYLFNRLADEYHAKGMRPPAAFGSLAQKKAFAELEAAMSYNDLIAGIDAALLKPILALSELIKYIAAIHKTGGMRTRPAAPGQPGGAGAPVSKERAAAISQELADKKAAGALRLKAALDKRAQEAQTTKPQ